MDREQFRKAGYAAIDRVCDYFETLESRDVMPSVAPGQVGGLINPNIPINGEEWADIASDFEKIILPGITHWQHPSFFAYFPANTTYESILADIYTGAVSNPGFNWLCSPACTELEVVMMDWVAQMMGLNDSFKNASNVGGGIIMGSASEACLTICIAARSRFLRLHPNTPFEKMIIFGTTQTHSLGAKAALCLGLEFRAIETRKEDDWSLRGTSLKAALETAKQEGKSGFIILATLGSTSTGAIDNLAEITEVAADYPELYVHLDGAWGGVYLSLPELREECQLAAINKRGVEGRGEIHSFCTNLHKAGLVTFDASCLWIRDRKLLTEALDITPPFLRNKQSDTGTVVDYRNWQIPLGRRFRSLKLYFTLRSYGVSGFQAHLRKLNDLAAYFTTLVLSEPERFDLFVERRFSLVVFRLKTGKPNDGHKFTNGDADDEKENALNREFFARIADRKDVHLTPTIVGGQYCTRLAVGSPFTERKHIDAAWKVILELDQEARAHLA